jgi:hypothetical protein
MRLHVQESLERLKQEVEMIVGGSPLGDNLVSVEVEPADDPDQSFLRIILQLRGAKKTPITDLIALQIRIEDALSNIDERFASVRFAEVV